MTCNKVVLKNRSKFPHALATRENLNQLLCFKEDLDQRGTLVGLLEFKYIVLVTKLAQGVPRSTFKSQYYLRLEGLNIQP